MRYREAYEALLKIAYRNICTHEERHRAGAIWEVCDGCSAKWADDEGGFKPSKSVLELEAIQDAVAKAHPVP